MTMTAARPTISPSSQWQLVTADVLMTDEMGSPVAATRDARRRAHITHTDTGEIAPKLTRLQHVYINDHAHDIILSEHNTYVRPHPHYIF